MKKMAQKSTSLANGFTKMFLPKINPLLENEKAPVPLLNSVVNGHAALHYSSHITCVPKSVQDYIEEKAKICQPDKIHICDGTEEENKMLLDLLEKSGAIQRLKKMDNCWLALTDPNDVARVEARTFISTPKEIDTIPLNKSQSAIIKPTVDTNLSNIKRSQLGNWLAPSDFQHEVDRRFPGCMRGRTMYVIPYSMGPIGGSISKIGIELTDSAYVVCSMRIMARLGQNVLNELGENGEFVRCLHSVGVPLPTTRTITNNWPCNPEMTMVGHLPENNEVISFGSGYGGNSLLGKKCFALRLGSILAKREGWLAEHMLILGITNPQGVKKYIAAAFPSACGKTNLSMLTSTKPGWKVECIGDDIAWMKFDKNGVLRAINPENGFFGVAPGTSKATNPNALKTLQKNTMFTNVAMTSDGGVYWEGLDDEMVSHGQHLTSWKGKDWTKESGEPAAHPNSRFCSPAAQCPTIDPEWENPDGVPISAIIFGGRRPKGIPLVFEAFDWNHGVYVGASMRSEATAAAEYKGKMIMHDPFAMRPFFGYNFGDYLKHWLSLNTPARQMPKIFHVNWFRKANDGQGNFLWPGFGENIRVLEWIFNRTEGNNFDIAKMSPIGYMPAENAIDINGLDVKKEDLDELFRLDKQFLLDEIDQIKKYFDENVNESTPSEVYSQIAAFKQRVLEMKQ